MRKFPRNYIFPLQWTCGRLRSNMSTQPIPLEHWLTKQEAASFLGVAEKTLDRMAARGEVQKSTRKLPGRPEVVVFHPDDIGRAKMERAKTPAPFIIQTAGGPVSDVSGTPVGHRTDMSTGTPDGPVSDMSVRHVSDALGAAVRQVAVMLSDTPQVLPPSELAHKLYLTESEAVRYTGLGKAALANMPRVRKGPRRAWVWRRAELEAM